MHQSCDHFKNVPKARKRTKKNPLTPTAGVTETMVYFMEMGVG